MNDQSTADTKRRYAPTRFNALRHGVLSRYTLLPWEDPDEYGRKLEKSLAMLIKLQELRQKSSET